MSVRSIHIFVGTRASTDDAQDDVLHLSGAMGNGKKVCAMPFDNRIILIMKQIYFWQTHFLKWSLSFSKISTTATVIMTTTQQFWIFRAINSCREWNEKRKHKMIWLLFWVIFNAFFPFSFLLISLYLSLARSLSRSLSYLSFVFFVKNAHKRILLQKCTSHSLPTQSSHSITQALCPNEDRPRMERRKKTRTRELYPSFFFVVFRFEMIKTATKCMLCKRMVSYSQFTQRSRITLWGKRNKHTGSFALWNTISMHAH